ncbi:MAG: aldo/keto reductase [Armatimonas sp.]
MKAASLVLGGHSFITQLGTDPAPDDTLAAEIVAACLDNGITWFDTTYQPERVALGKALARLNRRDEATILAWNFFTPFGPADSPGGHEPYQPHHLHQMQEELQTDLIDVLIVHPVSSVEDQARQEALAQEWHAAGHVGQLGTWAAPLTSTPEPYTLCAYPCNPTVEDASARFSHYHSLGWETLGTSPFVRGWEMEKRANESGRSKADVADELLRWAVFHPNVDRLIVSMRCPEWITTNLASLAKGPLT